MRHKKPRILDLRIYAAIAAIMLSCIVVQARNGKDSAGAGDFSLGMRTTVSAFSDAGSLGMGSGGEFRIRVSKHINTEWFADYITTNIQNLGFRRDAHIGWSVVFYLNKNPLTKGKVTPYLLAGHCFDYTRVYSTAPTVSPQDRWSSAVHLGFGIHYNLTECFDVSLLTQYMLHLGTHIETSILYDDATQQNYLNITRETGASLEGHLLTTLSVNYRIGKLWGKG
jgi:hypothetical protein